MTIFTLMSVSSYASFTAVVSLIMFLLISCASPKAPTGGPADTTPPRIIEEESTPNKQTNFRENEIVMTFDEWVNLKDVYSQLVISPPMPEEPEIRQRGKAVIIELPDSLRENTTYTINFGDAITDLNEGNILDNHVFVFSTGSTLDSNRMNGLVMSAVDLKPVKNLWVMLYKTGEDSAVYKRKPDYITKTNENGTWTVSFLPADTFDVVALKDENLNFLYDQEAELIGWLEESVYTGASENPVPPIFVFPRANRSIIKEVINVAPGWMKIVIESPLPKPMPELLPAIDSTLTMWDGDTLHVWFDRRYNYYGYALLGEDSTLIRASPQTTPLTGFVVIKPLPGRLRPGGTALFTSDIPIAAVDTSLILLRVDTSVIVPFVIKIDTVNSRRITMQAPWTGDKRYHMTFLPGAITDFWGRTNDTLTHSIVVSAADQFGDLTMTIDSLDPSNRYLILLKQGEQIIDTFVVEKTERAQIVKKGLPPAAYILEVIEDLNRNGTWDTGSYENRRQPERKLIFTPETLRAGWEQEVKMIWRSED